MCTKTFRVVGLNDQRTAYEVEEFLQGMPSVEKARADFIDDSILVVYDESDISEDVVLDHIEHAGCKPSKRIDGVIDHLRTKLGAL